MNDPRYIALRQGLEQLECDEIQRILESSDDDLLFDGGNYDRETNRYCPIAKALGIDLAFANFNIKPFDYQVNIVIGVLGRKRNPNFVYNQMHGIPGKFYKVDRPGDLRRVCQEIVAERRKAREEACS